ncbi:MAG: monothiol glutaredoxin, Grx4 family [Euryarchaeota archaeon]|nr:monothiol glutaredoxin, Grx4 family [Euryarchaeota archaeon]
MNWSGEELDALVNEHEIVLFMKGTPDMAMCGFSNRAAQVLQQLGEPFATVNILSDPKAIPSVCEWSDFPTMPQVFVHGELIGGSDIALEMFENGELRKMVDEGRNGIQDSSDDGSA